MPAGLSDPPVRPFASKLANGLRHPREARLGSRLMMLRWRALGLRAAASAVVIGRTRFEHPHRAFMASGSVIATGCCIKCVPGRFHLGENAYIGESCWISCTDSVRIERDAMLGPGCQITDANHGFSGRGPINRQRRISAPVTIGEGAWLGAGSKVLAGVRVGRGAVVGAGAVVTRDVLDYEIVAGVPARRIGVREEQSRSATTTGG